MGLLKAVKKGIASTVSATGGTERFKQNELFQRIVNDAKTIMPELIVLRGGSIRHPEYDTAKFYSFNRDYFGDVETDLQSALSSILSFGRGNLEYKQEKGYIFKCEGYAPISEFDIISFFDALKEELPDYSGKLTKAEYSPGKYYCGYYLLRNDVEIYKDPNERLKWSLKKHKEEKSKLKKW
ncbi:MAG: hypothetical protein IJM79_01700 [Erysipelotrichaceae bacterium]|nr:hypothetical protein [Erysipelotrichaceae bacterium]